MELSDSLRQALWGLVASLADNKFALGRRVSEWTTGAPTLESAVACAALAQEELGHARVLYPVLQELAPPDPGQAPGAAWPRGEERPHAEPAFEGVSAPPPAGSPGALRAGDGPSAPRSGDGELGGPCRVAFLDTPLPSWAHVVAALVLVDGALTTLMEALRESRFAPLARRVGRILEEERFHEQYAAGQLLEVASYPPGLEGLRRPVEQLLPEMLCWFGPGGDDGLDGLCREGLVAAGSDALRQAYLARVAPRLLQAGLEPAGLHLDPAGRWKHGDLPWQRWSADRRRLRGLSALSDPTRATAGP